MISNEQKKIILDNMIKELDLPDSAYETAIKRYEDLGKWFNREESIVQKYNPHIFVQGSFRLGTAIKPIDSNESYDLDLSCKLRNNISKNTHTQEELKMLVGEELNSYRMFRKIETKLETKHRCWRLEYKDNINFHMDVVPCIPIDESRIMEFSEYLENHGMRKTAAIETAQKTVNITDDRNRNFKYISPDWNISNPDGYADWFISRIYLVKKVAFCEGDKIAKAQIDDVPIYKQKTPLQRVIQLLKRHRDNMFRNKEQQSLKPISIIITTLAARAYNGEEDVATALENILNKMATFINQTTPRIPNPVDPKEDFADRWYRTDSIHLKLEENFNDWLQQAKIDFQHLVSTTDSYFLCEQMEDKLAIHINKLKLIEQLGATTSQVDMILPKVHTLDRQDVIRPWLRK